MIKPAVVKSAELKEGYWVRIGDESYAVHRVLSVSVVELPPVERKGWTVMPIICYYVGFFIAMAYGVVTQSWGIALLLILLSFVLSFGAEWYFGNLDKKKMEKKERRRESLRNVAIELDKERPRIVAAEIPKADAERLRMEIESIVAYAARSEAETKSKTNKAVQATGVPPVPDL